MDDTQPLTERLADAPAMDADFVQQVRDSATRLLDTIQHDELPEGGIYDVDIADETGLQLPTVRASLLGLAEDTLNVQVGSGDEPWVIAGVGGHLSGR